MNARVKINRTDFKASLGLSFEPLVFVANTIWQQIQTQSGPLPISLETENLLVSSGYHSYFKNNEFLAYKLTDAQLLGLLFTQGILNERNRQFQSCYGVCKTDWGEYHLTGGLGFYYGGRNEIAGPSP